MRTRRKNEPLKIVAEELEAKVEVVAALIGLQIPGEQELVVKRVEEVEPKNKNILLFLFTICYIQINLFSEYNF